MINFWTQPIHEPFYNSNEIIEKYDVIISLGSRGKGKTMSWKLRAIYNTLNNGKATIYTRRFKQELKDSRTNFLKDLYDGDPRLKDVILEIKGNILYVNGVESVYFIPLSTSLNKKSVSFHNVNMFIYDEFLTLGQTIRGIEEDVLFLEFLESVFRLRDDVKIILLSNAISTTSKYFEIFGFNKPINPKRAYQHPRHSKKVVIEIIQDNGEFRDKKESSKLYQLLPPSEYKKYSIENEFIFESTENIVDRKNIKGHLEYYLSIATKSGIIDIYRTSKYEYYLMLENEKERDLIFTFDKELTINGCVFISGYNDVSMMLSNAVSTKDIYYADMKVKKLFIENLKKIITTYF